MSKINAAIDFEAKLDSEARQAFVDWPGMEITPETVVAQRAVAMFPSEISSEYSVEKLNTPGVEENPDVAIEVYHPKRVERKLPCVLYIHGGGYYMGNPMDQICAHYLEEMEAVFVVVDYRLAPENTYPAALNDCYSASLWIFHNAEKYDIDAGRVAVAGTSAGGGLVAALALYLRDRKAPQPCFQMINCPMLDDRLQDDSSVGIHDKRVWNSSSLKASWRMYLGDLFGEDVPVYAAAARAENLTSLPSTYIYTGELDPHSDSNIDYIARLTKAGVATEFHLYPGVFHGWMRMPLMPRYRIVW